MERLKDRFTHEPLKGENDAPVAPRITQNVLDIFSLLAYDIHYLSPTDAATYFDRDYSTMSDTLRKLRRNGKYLRHAPEQENNPEKYWGGLLFYANAGAALDALSDEDYPTPPKRHSPVNLTHQVMIDQVTLDLLKGEKERAVRIIKWRDILQSPKMPEPTRKSQSPVIKLSSDEQGNKRFLCADGEPFVVESNGTQMFFLGKEADTGSERGEKIPEKLLNYIEVIRDNLVREKFGADSLNVLFAIRNHRRKENIMAKWATLTERFPACRKHLLFTVHPLYTKFKTAPLMGSIVHRELERVGYPPIVLSKI